MSKKRLCLIWIIATIALLTLFSFSLYDSANPGCSGLAVFAVWIFVFPISMAVMGITLLAKHFFGAQSVANQPEQKQGEHTE